MTFKLLGAVCVILGCGGFGFVIAANARREMTSLRQLVIALDFMECELNYRMTPLPQLCRLTASVTNGCIQKVFLILAEELELQTEGNIDKCISAIIRKCPDMPKYTAQRLTELGHSLGKFDLSGQIKCVQAINAENSQLLERISVDHNTRLRSYKTLGLCAGAALVILFI